MSAPSSRGTPEDPRDPYRYRVIVERKRVIVERTTVEVTARSRAEALYKAHGMNGDFAPLFDTADTSLPVKIISEQRNKGEAA